MICDAGGGTRHTDNITPPEKGIDPADLLIKRARSQLRVGNRNDALESIEEVLNLDPLHPGLQEIREEFNLDFPSP